MDGFPKQAVRKYGTTFDALEHLEWCAFFKAFRWYPDYQPLVFEIPHPGIERYNVKSRTDWSDSFTPTFHCKEVGFVHVVNMPPTEKTIDHSMRLAKDSREDVWIVEGRLEMPARSRETNRVIRVAPDLRAEKGYRMLYGKEKGLHFARPLAFGQIYSGEIQDQVILINELRRSILSSLRVGN